MDLRPGIYTVTFTLTGFSTVRREGIELPASFTATVNADLRVGALEETITVSGDAPIDDTTNVIRRQVVDSETVQAMPTSRTGRRSGDDRRRVQQPERRRRIVGRAPEPAQGARRLVQRPPRADGRLTIANMACNYPCVGVFTNDASTQELSYEIGAISAETVGGGVRVNIIPREGGNTFNGMAFGNFSNSALQTTTWMPSCWTKVSCPPTASTRATVGFARSVNPLNTTVNNATRTWLDTDLRPGTNTPSGANLPTNGDGIPQVNEMGPLGSTFGQLIVSTTYDPDVVSGWGKRRNNWESSTSVTHEIMPRVSADLAYFHRRQGNYTVTDNRDIDRDDYDEYCATAPNDSRLPNPGEVICGLYDIKGTAFGPAFADDNFVTFDEPFGKRSVTFNGVDVTVNARPTPQLFVNGGVSTGMDVDDDCDQIVDSPQKRFCRSESGWITAVKASGSYTLPWYDINLGGVLQNLQAQEIRASYSYRVTDTNLNRPFNGTTTRSVQLIEPGTMFTPRRTQRDLRVAKTFRMAGARRLQVMMDVYNTFNSNTPVGANSQAGETPPGINTNFGPNWLQPLNILQGRYVKFGAQFNF